MREDVRMCRKCGKPIRVIECGIYRSSVVDAAQVMVTADPSGEMYVRPDDSKVMAREDEYGVKKDRETAYRLHFKTCGH